MKSIYQTLIVLAVTGFVSQTYAASCADEIERVKNACYATTGPVGMTLDFKVRYITGGFIGDCTMTWNGHSDTGSATVYCDGPVPSPQPAPTPAPAPTPNPTPQPTPTPNPDQNPAPAPKTSTKPARDKSAIQCGSIILTDNQVLGETIPIVGANFDLAYFTNKVLGRSGDYTLHIPLTSSVYDAKFSQVKYAVKLNGTLVESKTLPITKNLSIDYIWDGLTKNISYGSINAEVSIEKIPGGKPYVYSVPVGSFQAKNVGLGGWVPTVYHFYDIARKQVLRGDGSSFSAPYEYLDENTMRVVDTERSLVYNFDPKNGKHLATLSFIRGRELFSFQHDARGYLASVTELFKVKTIFNRNSAGDLISITAPTGEVTQITLDTNKYLSSTTSPANQAYAVTYYDVNGLLKTFRKPLGQLSSFDYDKLGNLLRDAHSGGYSLTLDKTVSGSETVISSKTQMGRTTTYTEEEGMDGNSPYYERVDRKADGTFKQLWTTDEFNITYTRNISNKGKFVSNVTRTKPSTRFKNAQTFWYNVVSGTTTYNSTVRTEEWNADWGPFVIVSFSITDNFNGNKTTTNFLSETDTITTESPRGTDIFTKIDEWERPVSIKLGQDLATTLTYSNENLTRIAKGKRFVDYAYDPVTKRLSTVKNALGQNTLFSYDSAGRLTCTEYPNGKKILFEYNANDKLIGITPAHRPKHSFNFNSLELLTNYLPPNLSNDLQTPTSYSYNEDKQPLSVVNPDGKSINYNYDPKTGVLTTIDSPEGTYSYRFNTSSGEYDDVVNPNKLESEKVRLEDGFLQFDVLRMPETFLGFYKAIPDLNGRVKKDGIGGLKDTPMILIDYSYGVDEKLEKVGDEQISYDVFSSRISGTKTTAGSNSITDSYQYNEYGELSTYTVKSGNTAIYSLNLSYDLLGKIIKKVEAIKGNSQTFEYAYDLGGRLIEVKQNGSLKSKYSYDLNDNRTSGIVSGQTITASLDNQDRLISYNSENFEYNNNGDLISRKNNLTSQSVQYAFNSFGKITSVLMGSKTVEYQMDGYGRRAINSINGTPQNTYLYKDQIRLAGVVGVNGIALQAFGYGSKFHVPDIMVMNNETYRIITDQLGSVRLVVKVADGSIVQEMLHDDFGRLLKNTNPGFQPFGFAGGLYDANTGLVQFGARWYDPQVGRWISKDPVGFNGGDTNLYAYVGGDPMSKIDPTGLADLDLLPWNSPESNNSAQMQLTLDNFSVTAHGTSSLILDSNGLPMTASALASMIRANPKFKGVSGVTLHSCNTGRQSGNTDTFAQQLADILGISVTAPNEYIVLTDKGKTNFDYGGSFIKFLPRSKAPFR
ncbi:hypothetical protein CIK05_06655 [Bdellovibrio sp. qaytius]|nr:hypothetical protein CIK05_06655 [Bdellovibrio sp. qaytius]